MQVKGSLCRTAGRCFSHGGGGEGGGFGWKGDDGDGSGREGGGDSGEVVERWKRWWRGVRVRRDICRPASCISPRPPGQ